MLHINHVGRSASGVNPARPTGISAALALRTRKLGRRLESGDYAINRRSRAQGVERSWIVGVPLQLDIVIDHSRASADRAATSAC